MKALVILVNAVTLAAVLVILALPARAQSPCAPRDYILTQFAQRHHERPAAAGLAANGAVLELLVSKDGSTWTLIATGPNGITCIAATGTDWASREPKYGERG